MSRNTVILLVLLCAGVAGMIALSKMRSKDAASSAQNEPGTAQTASTGATQPASTPGHSGVGFNANPRTALTPTAPTPETKVTPNPALTNPLTVTTSNAATARLTMIPPKANGVNSHNDTNDIPQLKPIPELEKDYATATNRDVRLDIMMDIAETTGPEAVRALTRLFEAETDTDLKIDLLDSLLGIDGYKEEKLIMLTMGARQGLASEIRQSAIDGLIDLDDPRVVPVLNGLLNDPDPEIREGAKDALEMIQTQPPVKLGK
jgi:hypothetical protein